MLGLEARVATATHEPPRAQPPGLWIEGCVGITRYTTRTLYTGSVYPAINLSIHRPVALSIDLFIYICLSCLLRYGVEQTTCAREQNNIKLQYFVKLL